MPVKTLPGMAGLGWKRLFMTFGYIPEETRRASNMISIYHFLFDFFECSDIWNSDLAKRKNFSRRNGTDWDFFGRANSSRIRFYYIPDDNVIAIVSYGAI